VTSANRSSHAVTTFFHMIPEKRLARSHEVATIEGFDCGDPRGTFPRADAFDRRRHGGWAERYAPQWCEHGRPASPVLGPGSWSARLGSRLAARADVQACFHSAVETVGRFGAGASLTRGTRSSGSPHSRTSRREPDPRRSSGTGAGRAAAMQLEPGDAGTCRGRRSEVNSSECTCRRSVSRSEEAHE
jgi:hypothetical protein